MTIKPTRIINTINSLIDRIWRTYVEENIGKYIDLTDVSDHCPILSHFKYNEINHPSTFFIKRLMNDDALINFNHYSQQLKWSNVYKNNCLNGSFNALFTKFSSTFNQCFLLKSFIKK